VTARGRGPHTIELGRERVDLSYVEQLAEAGQTETIARIIGEFAAGESSCGVEEVANRALAAISKNGLDSLGSFLGHPGELSLPRPQEVAAATNRIRSLVASTRSDKQSAEPLTNNAAAYGSMPHNELEGEL
jgi:hypothetical protein